MKLQLKICISTFLLVSGIISISVLSPVELGYITENYFDFENDLSGWLETYSSPGSNMSITDETASHGENSAKLTNKTKFSYMFANETTFRLSTNSTFSFDWRFENKEGYYIGIIIATTGPNLYLISHFSGNYGNNSGYLVLEYENEQVNTWYHHTLNLSRLYLESYGEIPENITHVSIINRGYGSIVDGVATNQISYFDSLCLSSTGEIIDTPTPSNTSSISIPGFKIITGVLGMCIVSAVYISLAKRKK